MTPQETQVRTLTLHLCELGRVTAHFQVSLSHRVI